MAFSMRLERFCCCCTLRTGTLVIGTLGWIVTLIQLFSFVDKSSQEEKTKLLLASLDSPNNRYDDNENIRVWGNALEHQNVYARIGYGVVTFIVCVLLIWGVYKRDKRFVLPWLVLKGFEGVVVIIIIAITFIMGCVYGQGWVFVLFIMLSLLGALGWYFWLCVWSHYKELGEGEPHSVAPPVYYEQAGSAPPQYTEKAQYSMA